MVSWRTTVCGCLAALAVLLQAADWTSWRSLMLSAGVLGLGYFAHDDSAGCPSWVAGKCARMFASVLVVFFLSVFFIVCFVGCAFRFAGPGGVAVESDCGDAPPSAIIPRVRAPLQAPVGGK